MIRQKEGVLSALWKNGLKGIVKRECADPERWKERCGDINFIIDKVTLSTNIIDDILINALFYQVVPLLHDLLPHLPRGSIDIDAIAFGGHSYGALTGLFLGGTTVKPQGRKETDND